MFTFTATRIAGVSVTHLPMVVGTNSFSLTDHVLTPLMLLAFGAVAIYFGIKKYNTGRLIANTPTQKVRSLAPGRAELEGRGRVGESGLVPRPFSEGECLCANYKIEERREKKSNDDSNKTKYKWVTLDEGFVGNPFYLEDDTGRVEVDVDSLDLKASKENRNTITVRENRSTPDQVQKFISRDRPGSDAGQTNGSLTPALSNLSLSGITSQLGGTTGGGSRSNRRRYKEWVLPPDEETYVFGYATEREDDQRRDD